LTHEHTDHISALPVFLKKHPLPVHLPIGCAWKLEGDPNVAPLLVKHTPIYSEQIGEITIHAFPTPHDSQASAGFRIEIATSEGGVLRLGYATDIGYVSGDVREGLLGCEAVVLESNHDVEMLKTGPYPYVLKQRIASRHGHLSNVDSAAFAAELCECGTRALLLAHLSRENNTPELALDECISAVGDRRVMINVADPENITEVPL
jgi:phosphoribosyl 1,2-cyclic phosphodiesterase